MASPEFPYGRNASKPAGESFGFGTLITVFLPGLAAAIGILVVLQTDPGWIDRQDEVLNFFRSLDEWQQTFAAVALVSLLGALIAASAGFIEACIYDRITPAAIGISSAEFDNHWYEYLYRLSNESNSYVSRIVVWFLFEARMAVATVFVLAFYIIEAADREVFTVLAFLAVVGFLGGLGYHHHKELAQYRKRWYEQWRALREAERAVAEKR